MVPPSSSSGESPSSQRGHVGQCDEVTLLVSIFYLAFSKGLVFFLAGLLNEGSRDPNRIRFVFLQYVGSVFFCMLASCIATGLYCSQAITRSQRRAVYVACGAVPNLCTAVDCIGLLRSAYRIGQQAVFPDVVEVAPVSYRELLDCKSLARTWYAKECSICLESFEDTESVIRLPCGHIFHADCGYSWLRQARTCPIRCKLDCFLAIPPGEDDVRKPVPAWEAPVLPDELEAWGTGAAQTEVQSGRSNQVQPATVGALGRADAALRASFWPRAPNWDSSFSAVMGQVAAAPPLPQSLSAAGSAAARTAGWGRQRVAAAQS